MTIQDLYIKTKPSKIEKEFKSILSGLLKSNEIKELAADLNRVRLEETGKDIDGKNMRTFKAQGSNAYSNRTIIIKEGKGQITDHFTGKDKGKLHDSIKAVGTKKTIRIKANNNSMIKLSENIDTSRMLGFSDEDIEILIEEMRPEVYNQLISYLK